MAWPTRIALGLAVCVTIVVTTHAQEPRKEEKAKVEKAKVEFRWLASKPAKGITEEKGIQTTCGPELLYPHLKPALTNADVDGTILKQHDFSQSGLGKELYTVDFQLSEAARKKLLTEAGDQPVMQLATFVDGKYWGTGIFRKADAAKFTPTAGFISSKTEAERIVEACK